MRYQVNPTANWGPGRKATEGKVEEEAKAGEKRKRVEEENAE